MMKHSISVQRTAHYYTLTPKGTVRSILFVLHGYAQRASEFIEEFSSLDKTNTLIVAPEALSKFYNKQKQPVANWMTSHEREDEIQDYIHYLNQLSSQLQQEFGNVPIRALGFSQGVSTLLRWVTNSPCFFDDLYLCAGTIPPELTASDFYLLNKSNFYYYYGDQDKLLLPEKAKEQVNRIQDFKLSIQDVSFHGRHEIPATLIDQLADTLP